MICPKCGIYNPYGRQECAECGHAFVARPIELSSDETEAAQERQSQPYFYTAKPEYSEPKPENPFVASVRSHTRKFAEKSGSIIQYVTALFVFIVREIKKNRRACKIIIAVLGIIAALLLGLCISCAGSCIAEHKAQLAAQAEEEAAALAAQAALVDPVPSITSMSDVWVLNQYGTKLTLQQDGSFTDTSDFSTGSGTWSYDADSIYLVYSDGTLKNYTYELLGDYLILDWEVTELTRNCNESESVEEAGLWISGSGFALALHEDGTHGATSEEYGKYANAWAAENGVIAMVTIRNNVEYFDYFGYSIDGDVMQRLSGTVYVREGGGITLGGGDIEFSAGYDPDA